jgi:hypothetical protein
MDHPILKLANLDRIIDVYRQYVSPGPERVALLLDEVQYADNWGTWIKHAVDFNPEYKILATGSAALDIQEKGAESGTGRWTTIKLPTLSFYEFLKMKSIDVPALPKDFKVLSMGGMKKREISDLISKCMHLRDYFNRYLLLGGFPELIEFENIEDAQRLLREDIVDKVLKRDMTSNFGVRQVDDFEKLFIYLCLHSGGIFEKKTIADQLQVSVPTVEKYLSHLESANLIYKLVPFSESGKQVLKGRPKIHLADVALRNAVLLKNDDILTIPEEMGLIVETAVYKHFNTFYYTQKPQMGYWRDNRQKEKEVDLIIKTGTWTIPVEIKYRENIKFTNRDGLFIFMEKNPVKMGILVSKKSEDFEIMHGPSDDSTILKIPAFLLLFLLGHSERNLWSIE